MKISSFLSCALLAATALARSPQHVGKKLPQVEKRQPALPEKRSGDFPKRQASPFLTGATQGMEYPGHYNG